MGKVMRTPLLWWCYRWRVALLAWRIRQSNPTGCPQLCLPQILWLVSPLKPACFLKGKRARPSLLATTQTSPACPLSSPAQATAGRHPPTEPAQVSARSSCRRSVFPSTLWFATSHLPVVLSKVRQVLSPPGLLNNLQLLDGPANHSLSSPYNSSTSTWNSGPFAKPPLHSHAPTSLYTSSFASSRDGYSSPSREGRDSPQLQEALKAERLSPAGGLGVSSSFLNLTSAAGNLYTQSSHSHPHMLSPYSSYMAAPQDYNAAGLYASPGSWISPSYSPKLHNKMRISTPGENTRWSAIN